MKIKKIMWSSLAVQMIALLIIFSLLLMGKPISDLLSRVWYASLLITIISSFFVHRKGRDQIDQSNYSFRKNLILGILLLLPIVAMLIITRFVA